MHKKGIAFMFYDRFNELCAAKNVKPTRACIEMGLSASLAAKWKNTGTKRPSAEVLEKMSAYFDMPIDEILQTNLNSPMSEEPHELRREDVKFALFGDSSGEITDEILQEVMDFANFLVEREKEKRKNSK